MEVIVNELFFLKSGKNKNAERHLNTQSRADFLLDTLLIHTNKNSSYIYIFLHDIIPLQH